MRPLVGRIASSPYNASALNPNTIVTRRIWRLNGRQSSRGVGTKPIASLTDNPPLNQDVAIKGHVRSVRTMKNKAFVDLGDGSTMMPLQAVVPNDVAKGLNIGTAALLSGQIVPAPKQELQVELQVRDVEILGHSDPQTFPIQKKYQSPQFLRRMPHLRTRIPYNAALLQLRSDAIASLTTFFHNRNFVQTHTPIITSSDCEGAGEAFSVSTSKESPTSVSSAFFGTEKYLTVSSQLHLEALAQSVGNVWTLSPTFRAEQSDTSRHLSEFYMLEAEMGYATNMSQVMDLIEDMIRHLAKSMYLQSRAVQEIINYLDSNSEDHEAPPKGQLIKNRWLGLQQEAWPRITYTEAIDLLSAAPSNLGSKPSWGEGLQSQHEKYIAQLVGQGKPVFVTQYPKDIKAFYMLPTSDTNSRETVECFDLLVPDYCEIAGGSMREHQLEPLLKAMKARGMSIPSSFEPEQSEEGEESSQALIDSKPGSPDWYVDLRRWGSAPHGGFGLGFDRLLAYLSGVETIRDMVTFPRWHGRCDC